MAKENIENIGKKFKNTLIGTIKRAGDVVESTRDITHVALAKILVCSMSLLVSTDVLYYAEI